MKKAAISVILIIMLIVFAILTPILSAESDCSAIAANSGTTGMCSRQFISSSG